MALGNIGKVLHTANTTSTISPIYECHCYNALDVTPTTATSAFLSTRMASKEGSQSSTTRKCMPPTRISCAVEIGTELGFLAHCNAHPRRFFNSKKMKLAFRNFGKPTSTLDNMVLIVMHQPEKERGTFSIRRDKLPLVSFGIMVGDRSHCFRPSCTPVQP